MLLLFWQLLNALRLNIPFNFIDKDLKIYNLPVLQMIKKRNLHFVHLFFQKFKHFKNENLLYFDNLDLEGCQN